MQVLSNVYFYHMHKAARTIASINMNTAQTADVKPCMNSEKTVSEEVAGNSAISTHSTAKKSGKHQPLAAVKRVQQ